MRAVDTNVLVRPLMVDHAEQARAAEHAMDKVRAKFGSCAIKKGRTL